MTKHPDLFIKPAPKKKPKPAFVKRKGGYRRTEKKALDAIARARAKGVFV